ncbi:unnamed protein product, partial [Nesidiocoris tenuis]
MGERTEVDAGCCDDDDGYRSGRTEEEEEEEDEGSGRARDGAGPGLESLTEMDEPPVSLGSGLEYDLWEGQFAFSGGAGHDCPALSPWDSPRDRNGNRADRIALNKACNHLSTKRAKILKLTELLIQVQMLQEQMSVLADNQNHSDERYTRARQENATLQARVLMLEEQLREVELRAQEKLQDEERRHRELVARVDREKQLQVENCAIRLQTLELENASVREEAVRCRTQADKLRSEVLRLEEEQSRCEAALAALREELEIVREQERQQQQVSQANQQLIEELSQELERLRIEHKRTLEELEERGSGVSPTAHEQLRAKFTQLREENKRLQEAHDELQALLLTRSVEEGRNLLTGHQSLAAELEAMSQGE